MAYTKNVWVDQNVQRPKTYEVTNNADGSVTLTDSFGVVTEIGTPVNAVNMNHIEEGIADNDTAITTINGKIPSNASGSNKMAVSSDIAAINTALTLKADKTQFHALKGYSDNGELLTDSEGLADVKSYAHSTFDLSKFTVVGSPNITNDGLAIFNSTSRIDTGITLELQQGQTFKIKQRWIVTEAAIQGAGTTSGIQQFLNFNTSNVTSTMGLINLPQYHWLRQYIPVHDFVNNTDINIHIDFQDSNQKPYNPSVNDVVDYEFYYDTTNYFQARFRINGGQWVYGVAGKDGGGLAMENYTLKNTVALSINRTNSNYTRNIHDLKMFYVEVDGVEVFSGNRTDIDTIKPDDYTVVGTPTISDDGIASGFTTTKYLTAPSVDLTNVNEVILEAEVTVPTVAPESNTICMALVCGKMVINMVYYTTYIATTAGVPTAYSSRRGQTNLPYDGSKYIIQGVFTDMLTETPKYYCRSKKVGETAWTQHEPSEDRPQLAGQTSSSVIIGLSASNTNPFSLGSLNLNTIKIYTDGDLKYQPCLKIPYTESKTGSKIVDSIYRDRVNDMAEQFGYANYYTLDEDNGNFTLPQVELYGYIEKRARDIAHPIAQPFYRFSDEINEDEVRLEGAEVDKGLYLAIEQDPYLSALCTAGSTADKICLPDFRDRVIYGGVASGYVEPELPNITGLMQGVDDNSWSYTGCFYEAERGGSSGSDMNGSRPGFDASRSSSIYKDGATVKTAGVKARWLCRWK